MSQIVCHEGKANMNKFVVATLLTIISGTHVGAQTMYELMGRFEGLYFPASASPSAWSCRPDQVGMDGGALAIGSGYLDGLENRCELTNPQPISNGTSVRFTAICSAEGETYSEPVIIAKTASGVTIERDGRSVAWTACPVASGATTEPVAVQGGWVFADGVASIHSGGNYLEFSCVPAGAASTIPTARMYGCPLCWQGDEIDFGFRIDGGVVEKFTFTKQSNAEGMTSDLYGYPAWHDGIITQLMAGHLLHVYEGDSIAASYPLTGSSAALGALMAKCN
jgi:hypothetical protein